ncbi:IPT/TIG domain-containing protein [Streptomyces sp. PT12]|uniref:IPT/TIG domain-containing protein n=1 Tax=Streptomyces sp. PT12 TaxID=1510197 RepID=UPI000DE2EE8E|nr:IPT/TIG domain-containing protein [Streptomyces sp. PT12]RBM04741.1 cell shape-determining protein [Streptomyces sp. PT12]
MGNSDPVAGTARPTAVIAAAPVLSSVVPNVGPSAGSNVVSLGGSGFTGVTGVSFGAAPALVYTVNSTVLITATVPPGTGTVAVTVRNPSGTSNSVPYTYAATPTLTGISPNQGPTSGGTSVTLTGTGLFGASAVSFGGTPATSFIVNSATSVTAVAPAGTGAVPVTVTTPGGTSGAVFFYYSNAPALISASPSQGPTAGGTSVTLTGTGLGGATAVSFGGTPATGFVVNSATSVTAVAPAGTGSVAVTVTTPGGTSNSVTYTYVPAPVLVTLAPAQGPTGAGAVVTLTGSSLTTALAVLFGGTPAAFDVLSDTTVTAIAPAGPAGSTPVTVTTAGGTSNALTYTRVPPPQI